LFHLIEERRKKRELSGEAKLLLTLDPKKRRAGDIVKLLQYHAHALHNIKDAVGFKVFNNTPKKNLQNIYKNFMLHVAVPPNTPIAVQGMPGNEYFILLKGSINCTVAGEKRIKEIHATTGHRDWLPCATDISSGFMGKSIQTVAVAKEANSPAVGFGGVEMCDVKGTWFNSCITTTACDIIHCDFQHYKNHFYSDHRAQYVLAQRIKKLRDMPVFVRLEQTQIEHLADDLSNNEYTRSSVLVDRGDPFDKLIIVLSGSVTVYAYVSDPLHPSSLVEVQLVTVGAGSILGDIERVNNRRFWGYKIVSTGHVETVEGSIELLNKNIFSNPHTAETRKLIEKAVAQKQLFHENRISTEIAKFIQTGMQMAAEKLAQNRDAGGVAEKLTYIRKEWEKEYEAYVAKHHIITYVHPTRDVIKNRLYLERNISSAKGYTIESRLQKKVLTNCDYLPESLVMPPIPVYVHPDKGMRVGSSAGGPRTKEVREAINNGGR
jgi:CRP-like cAMP-binding protein